MSLIPSLIRISVGSYASAFGHDVISHVNVSAAQRLDGGNYACEASNEAGTQQHSARLNV